MSKVPAPSKESIEKYLERWKTLENYRLQESSLGKLFHELCPDNTSIESILLKVSALNDFYSTNIYDTYSVARHIKSLNIESRLNEGDYSLVNDIAKNTIGGKNRNFYSFASKYCSHHRPERFPIYDSYVEKMLKHYKKLDKFARFKNDDLRVYQKFIEVIEGLRKHYQVENFSLRVLDIFLWLVGKDYFPNVYKKA